MKFVKCWFNGHKYNKPRVRLQYSFPYVRLEKTLTCKNCGKKRRLTSDEHFRIFFTLASLNVENLRNE